jgi:cytochrome oxidase Cu insertion factor (SCO1/SenC/PrrC family)
MQTKLPPGTKLVEVTLDPIYDRPPVLAKYGATFGANPAHWLLLTGDAATIDAFAARFGILQSRTNTTTIVHSERLAVVDPQGRITRLFDNADWNPNDVLAALASAWRISAATSRRE